MRVRIKSNEIGIKRDTECDVLSVWVFCTEAQPWYLFVDDGTVCVSVSISDVEVVDGSLDRFRLVRSNNLKSEYFLLVDFLQDNMGVYDGLLDCDANSYRELQQLKSIARI